MSKSRRHFIQKASLASAPLIVNSSVLGREGATSPNSRVQMACIGVGGQGTGNMSNFLQDDRVKVLAVCDVDQNHRDRALGIAKLDKGDGYNDYRKLMGRKDIDAVMIATPDHWHSLITIAAARSGKDIYCEKPLAASIGEGRLVADIVKNEKRVLQCGTWRRSGIHSRMACEWVRNGYIGDLKKVTIGVPGSFHIRGGYSGMEGPQEIPKGFDYKMWSGTTPDVPYTAARCHFNFRWIADYAPGYVTDWGAHFIDVAHWGMNADDTGPIEISAKNVKRREKGIYDAVESFHIRYLYAGGVEMNLVSTNDTSLWGTKFIGTEGSIFVENQKLITDPPELLRKKLTGNDERLYVSKHHHRNFIDCVLSRKRTASSVESAHRAASVCHLGSIATETGELLKFDSKKERFLGNPEANDLLMRKFHGKWKLS
ncbi:MAG: dehydrogenase [Verrucomicrobiales bacterium]|nr:dehydrogenase [Verrucomicrobiales bacterium]